MPGLSRPPPSPNCRDRLGDRPTRHNGAPGISTKGAPAVASRLAVPGPVVFGPESRLKAAAGSTPHPRRPLQTSQAGKGAAFHSSFVRRRPRPSWRGRLDRPSWAGPSQSTTDTEVSVVCRPKQDARSLEHRDGLLASDWPYRAQAVLASPRMPLTKNDD